MKPGNVVMVVALIVGLLVGFNHNFSWPIIFVSGIVSIMLAFCHIGYAMGFFHGRKYKDEPEFMKGWTGIAISLAIGGLISLLGL